MGQYREYPERHRGKSSERNPDMSKSQYRAQQCVVAGDPLSTESVRETSLAPRRQRKPYDSMADAPEPVAFKRKPAAHYLGISVQTLDRLVRRGLIRPNRALRHLVFSREELLRFLRNGQ